MPRIEAENIQAHVRQQTDRIVDAASKLFSERGYQGTELSDIAKEVGLARNSLYRYYPNKDYVLLACLKRDMAPGLARLRKLEDSVKDPRKRIEAWIALQMEIALTTCHDAIHMLADTSENSDDFRRQISALHEPPAQVLRRALDELFANTNRDVALMSAMITSMVHAAASRAMETGQQSAVLAQVSAAVRQVLLS